ncbi:hypothetical protein N9B82_05245 [Saprospiraceae bacterium]|nr:hypothetical protein [Saprospiraceae bacterium]
MKNIIASMLLCFFTFSSFGQSEEFMLVLELDATPFECNTRSVFELKRNLKKSYSENIIIVESAGINTLSINSEVVANKLLEGMDTYYFAEVETVIKIKSNINSLEKSITIKSEAKGKNECDSKTKAFLKSVKGKNKKKVLELLQSFNDENFSTFCTSISEKSASLMAESKFQEALSMLNNIPEDSECVSALVALRDKVELEIAAQHCEKEIHELTIIVNSGELSLIKGNIYRLLRISPNAPCASEAIALSEKIGKVMKTANSSSKDLTKFELYITENNQASWRNNYIRSKKL